MDREAFAYLTIYGMHRLIDIAKFPPIGISFGVNAIAAYAGSWVATCILAATGLMDKIYAAWFATQITPRFGPFFSSLLAAVIFTAIFALLMWGSATQGVAVFNLIAHFASFLNCRGKMLHRGTTQFKKS